MQEMELSEKNVVILVKHIFSDYVKQKMGVKSMKIYLTTASLVIFFLAGCSHQSLYTGIQANKRSECLNSPQYDIDECMTDANKPYQNYKQEREELLEKKELQTKE